jgi:DNA-binding response OmpR family regulator
MRALIADDDRLSTIMLGAALRRWEFDVSIVDNGEAALAQLEADDRATLAILDWMMPGLDGPEVCRRVRSRATQPPTYIILLTARSARADIVAGLDAGADDYLTKPYDPEELRARVHVGRRMLDALTRVDQLSGLLPICSYCKRVRADGQYWEQVESYVSQHSRAVFSHGICPDCYARAMAELEQA